MSNLYLDCEFNGFHGPLISLALVKAGGGELDYFYEALEISPIVPLHPWVKDHVLPVIDIEPISPYEFRERLWQFLQENYGAHIYADWPEDFAHLMQWSCAPNGMAPRLELTMHYIQSGQLNSHQPHNALEDARALMEWHQTTCAK